MAQYVFQVVGRIEQAFCLFRSTLHPEYKIASLESILSLKVYENKRVHILNIRVNSWLNS
ncbi:MAG: hypothetical protein IEMM0008_0016 [bacterium]|nr:MAG: hypothetical protein IEMM0008_0016 [bacterium]